MSSGFIPAIERLTTFEQMRQMSGTESRELEGSAFIDIFQNAINDVTQTQLELDEKQYLLATGQLDDVHTVTIAAAEAQMSVDLLVQLRNTALEAYNELMRMSF